MAGYEGYGRYEMLEARRRHFKGPRNYEPSGPPLHFDNLSLIKERLFLETRPNPDVLHNAIYDLSPRADAPWTVMKSYHRTAGEWHEGSRWKSNNHVSRKEKIISSPPRVLMPARRDQALRDLPIFQANTEVT